MDYDLSRLGDKQFEHLAQALLVKYLGPHVQVFGAGPDGGREATWHGPVSDPRLPGPWNGYGVAQAKYMSKPRDPSANLAWLRQQVTHEFDEWTKETTRRKTRPEFYLLITNVVLSPASNGGIDRMAESIKAEASKRGLVLQGFAIWHYDQIRVMLDEAPGLHKTYAAWTTPGDVLAELVQSHDKEARNLSEALRAHAAKVLVDEKRLNLTQAGSVGDGQVGIADVFVDLPAYPPVRQKTETSAKNFEGLSQRALPGIAAEMIAIGDRKFDNEQIAADASVGAASRVVLIGGPGQGKSTVGQYLCQIYRAAFLEKSPVVSAPQVREVRNAILKHATEIGLEHPRARRWPIRIVLNELADALSRQTSKSIIEYVAQQLTSRSSIDIDAAQMRGWLRDYPWFVVFDGLDEVPETSNRGQVLKAISDFLIDSRSLNADVLTLATSRPQGYNDDFGRDECRHYELSELPRELAVSYARRLIDVRTGAGSNRARQVATRLKRAAEEDATSHLLTTPLQVTILTLLLERLGHAPRDRWRLFSQYYRVIYQREQEKGGDLAELLHTHESDVHAIHFRIGLMLQRRGERSGDTRGAISKNEFVEVISDRLQSQGNDAQSAEQLAKRLVTLATDRLVFLAVLQGDQIGFEIRSLQEFMAAESLLTRPDAEAVEGLKAIASSEFWRNVLMFAVGRVFADKEHLRSDVVTICADLNLDTPLHKATLPGSRLALEILRERVTSSQPAFTRLLAAAACQLLQLPPAVVRGLGLESLASFDARPQLIEALEAALREPSARRVTGIMVLAALADSGDEAAFEWLSDVIRDADTKLKDQILLQVDAYTSASLAKLLVSEVSNQPPSRALAVRYRLGNKSEDSHRVWELAANIPSHFSDFIDYCDVSGTQERVRINMNTPSEIGLSLNCIGVPTGATQNWEKLLRNSLDNGPWRVVKRFVEFCVEPSSSRLAAALEKAISHPREAMAISRHFPWPLAACFPAWDTAVDFSLLERRLSSLASAARRGLLGESEDWLSAEKDWQRDVWEIRTISEGLAKARSYEGFTLPFGRPFDTPVPLLPFVGLMVTQPHEVPDFDRLKAWIREAFEVVDCVPESEQRVGLVSMFLFLCSIVDGWDRSSAEIKGLPEVDPSSLAGLQSVEVFRLLKGSEHGFAPIDEWIGSLPAGTIDLLKSELTRLGGLPNLKFLHYQSGDSQNYVDAWLRDPENWRLGRFALHLRPSSLRANHISLVDESTGGSKIYRRFLLFASTVMQSLNGDDSSDRAWLRENTSKLLMEWPSNSLDDVLYSGRDEDTLSFSRLTSWITQPQYSDRGLEFASKLALVLLYEGPALAGELIKSLYAVVASRPASSLNRVLAI